MSNYIEERCVNTTRTWRPRWAVVLSTLFALALAFTLFVPLFGLAHTVLSQPVQAQAFAPIFCGADIGVGMDDKRRPSDALFTSYKNIDAPDRKWTLQEAYGSGMNVVSFQGFGSGNWVQTKELADGAYTPKNFDAVMAQFEEIRTPYTCTIGAGAAFVSSLQIKIAGMVASFTNTVVGAAVGTNLFCSEAGEEGCFDLLGIIGGDSNSDDSSLISILGRSIYMPLLLFAVVAAAVSIAYQGIVKHRYRDAFGKALWVVGSAVLGLMLLLMPYNLVQAPTILANGFTSCLIGAFNGQNCMTDTTSNDGMSLIDENSAYANICSAGANGASTTEQFDFMIETLGCSIWAAFVLEPYSKASFGVPFAELNTTDANNVELQQAITDAGLEPEAFCINLASTGSAADNVKTRVDMDGGSSSNTGTVCNLAAYQMFLTHDTTPASAHEAGGMAPESGETDERWYNIAAVAAHSDGLWDSWKSSTVSDFNKVNMGITAVLSSIVGAVLLVVVSFYALIYKVGGMILIGIAPLFLLFMIEPTRGRKIAAGYLGQLLSVVFKYMASVLFLLISLMLFGALLARLNSLYHVNVLLIVILSGALLMYRAEFVELLGRVNMGTTVFTDKISDRVKGTASLAGNTTMGGIGSKFSGGSFSEGATRTLKQEVASGRGKQAFGDGIGGLLQSGVLAAGSVQRLRQHSGQQGSVPQQSGAPRQTQTPQQSGNPTQVNAPQQSGSNAPQAQAGAPQQSGGSKQSNAPQQSGGSKQSNAPQQTGGSKQTQAAGSGNAQKQSNNKPAKVKVNVKPQATDAPHESGSGVPVVNAPQEPRGADEPVNVKINVETEVSGGKQSHRNAPQTPPVNTQQSTDKAKTESRSTARKPEKEQPRSTARSASREERRIDEMPTVNAPQHDDAEQELKPEPRTTVRRQVNEQPRSTDSGSTARNAPHNEPRVVDIPEELKEQPRSTARSAPQQTGIPRVNDSRDDAQQPADTSRTQAGRSAPRQEPRTPELAKELKEQPRPTTDKQEHVKPRSTGEDVTDKQTSQTGSRKQPPRIVGIPTRRPDEAKKPPQRAPREQPPEEQ